MPAASAIDQSVLVEEQAALRRVATLVARGDRPAEIFSAVSDEVGRLFGSEAAIARFEPDGSAMVIVGLTAGIPVVSIGDRWEHQDFLASTAVYRTGHPARYDYRSLQGASGSIAASLRKMGIVSTVAAPIVVGGNLWGVITASDVHKPLPPDAEERLKSFTELVATAIANAESRAELAASQTRAHELAGEQAALRRVATLVAKGAAGEEVFSSVAAEVGRLLGLKGIGVDRYESDGRSIFSVVVASLNDPMFPVGSRWPLDGPSLRASIYETGRPARIEAAPGLEGTVAAAAIKSGARWAAGAPIIVDGAIWGSITAGTFEDEPIPDDIEERLEAFTELVSTAIANSDAREQVSGLLDEQAALRRVATLVARGVPAPEILDAVAAEVERLFGADWAAVQQYEPDGVVTVVSAHGGLATDIPVGASTVLDPESVVATVIRTGRSARMEDELGLRSVIGAPITVEGRVWGVMVAIWRQEGPAPATDVEGRMANFTELVGTAIANAESRAELDASRARIVATADATRRRIERDLHDGIQQWLVTLALKARMVAAASAPGDPREGLSEIADDLVKVVDELREISRGIHPAILSEAGLDDALEALARRSPLRVALDVTFEGRYDPTLEATVYYVAAESLTNAVKHARASIVSVRGGLRGEAIELEIEDDGVGGADPRSGSGIIGLKDRIDSLGGTISISSPAGVGTTIRVRLPLGPRDEGDPRVR